MNYLYGVAVLAKRLFHVPDHKDVSAVSNVPINQETNGSAGTPAGVRRRQPQKRFLRLRLFAVAFSGDNYESSCISRSSPGRRRRRA
ncbi:hypothetical protein BURKHO8Y_70062 [Burkholderia sp. 8Y]|nr:hypothetical protein BURKHO8Y_70062 [Burkholderia sp. 8Y]